MALFLDIYGRNKYGSMVIAHNEQHSNTTKQQNITNIISPPPPQRTDLPLYSQHIHCQCIIDQLCRERDQLRNERDSARLALTKAQHYEQSRAFKDAKRITEFKKIIKGYQFLISEYQQMNESEQYENDAQNTHSDLSVNSDSTYRPDLNLDPLPELESELSNDQLTHGTNNDKMTELFKQIQLLTKRVSDLENECALKFANSRKYARV